MLHECASMLNFSILPIVYSIITVTTVNLCDPTQNNQNDQFTRVAFYFSLNIVRQLEDVQLWPKHVAALLNKHSCVGRNVHRFVIKKKLRKLKHSCGSEFARIVMFDVNGCRLLVKYVGVYVCGDSIDVQHDNTDSHAAYKQCTKGFGIA